MVSLSLVALALGGCGKRAEQAAVTQPVTAPPLAALPLATTEAPALNLAPPASALPGPPSSIPVAQRSLDNRYGYLDRAYGMSYGFADAPPDYTVDYDGYYPWVWRADSGAYRIVEPLDYGERYYYYKPGYDYPFFISDPYYGYAYDGYDLVGVYDPYGAPLDYVYYAPRIYDASRYFYRARNLYSAAIYRQRRSAYADDWWARRDDLRRVRTRWEEQIGRDPGWRAWRAQHGDPGQRDWGTERQQRLAYAATTAGLLNVARDRAEHRRVEQRAAPGWFAASGDRRSTVDRPELRPRSGWQDSSGNRPALAMQAQRWQAEPMQNRQPGVDRQRTADDRQARLEQRNARFWQGPAALPRQQQMFPGRGGPEPAPVARAGQPQQAAPFGRGNEGRAAWQTPRQQDRVQQQAMQQERWRQRQTFGATRRLDQAQHAPAEMRQQGWQQRQALEQTRNRAEEGRRAREGAQQQQWQQRQAFEAMRNRSERAQHAHNEAQQQQWQQRQAGEAMRAQFEQGRQQQRAQFEQARQQQQQQQQQAQRQAGEAMRAQLEQGRQQQRAQFEQARQQQQQAQHQAQWSAQQNRAQQWQAPRPAAEPNRGNGGGGTGFVRNFDQGGHGRHD
jgi:hypothetical protein